MGGVWGIPGFRCAASGLRGFGAFHQLFDSDLWGAGQQSGAQGRIGGVQRKGERRFHSRNQQLLFSFASSPACGITSGLPIVF